MDRHSINLIKKNILYIITLFIFIFLALYLVNQLNEYVVYENKNAALEKELADLNIKKNVIYSFDPAQLNGLVSTLNTLLPAKEDYFSIFTSLQNVAQSTGFKIDSYTVNFAKNNEGKVSIAIKGEGDPNTLLKFLQSYQFTGGRLITMDSVQFSPSTTKTTLNLNFYSKNVRINDTATPTELNRQMIQLINTVGTNIPNGTITQDAVIPRYPPKADPFGSN